MQTSVFLSARYIDYQLTHARIEVVASILRFKHGPLLQRLRYVFRKDQFAQSSPLTQLLKSRLSNEQMRNNGASHDLLKPFELMDEFLLLNKKLHRFKTPELCPFSIAHGIAISSSSSSPSNSPQIEPQR
jgi:hypothetical protein